MSTTKGTPLTKEEVALLVDLVEPNKIITSKATNATNNLLKEAAWLKITDAFNASVSSCPRRIEQLKLKWENLKKTARKRSALIRLNRNKTGGGKPNYIPPEDTLDRVASILGATCEGYSVPFGGNFENNIESQGTESDSVSSRDVIIKAGEGAGGGDGVQLIETITLTKHEEPQPKKFFFTTPSRKNVDLKRKRKLEEDDVKARISRNNAITAYYNEKRIKLKLESENLELTNKKIKLELENLYK